MPRIGNVQVSDDVIRSLGAGPEPERPGALAVLGASARNTIGQLRYGLPYQAEVALGTLGRNDEQFYQQGLARTAQEASAAAPASVSDLTSGRVGFGGFLAENLAASLPYMVGGAAGALAGARLGGVRGAIAGGIVGGVPQFDASNIARAVEEQGSLTPASAARALAVAPLQSAADFAVARFLPGAGRVLGDVASTQAGGFLRRTAASITKAGATEAATEAAQQVGERWAAGAPITTPDAAAEYVNAAVTAFAVGGVLGAGGGFRRTPAHSKPASEVTDTDLNQAIDQFLALPAPTDIAVDAGGTARVNPNTAPPLALPGPEQFAQPDAIAAPEGVAVGEDPFGQIAQSRVAARDPRAPTGDPGPTIDDILAQITAGQPDFGALARQAPAFDPATFQAPPTATSVNALSTERAPVAPVDVPATPRLFADQSWDDIQAALRATDATDGVRAEAEREVEARRLEAIGETPLTTDNFQQRVDELKTGLRGGWVQGLEASDPADLRSKVYTRIFEDQDTARNVQRLAQRVGLLDENLEPTAAANAIEAERTAAAQAETDVPPAVPAATVRPAQAPANSDAAKEWDQLKRAAGIERIKDKTLLSLGTPASRADAEASVLRALARDESNAAVSPVEKLAQQMGIITNDDARDITPKGRQVFLATPEGLEATVAAAQEQGFAGAQASVFERGVRAQLSGDTAPTFTNFEEMAAYEQGRVWAQDFVQNATTRTAAQTAAIQARQATRATGRAADRTAAPRTELTPAQVQQQGLNRLLDAADLRTVPDSDIATLRRMVREGASAQEVGQALQQVQGGQTLFRESPRRAAAPTAERPVRGQPRFREMNTQDTPAKAQQRAESEPVVQAYNLRNFISFILGEKGMTQARADRLNTLLDQGDIAAVQKNLKPFDPDGVIGKAMLTERDYQRYRRDFWRGKQEEAERAERILNAAGGADERVEQGLTGKDFNEAVQWMVDNAPSPYFREVMSKIQELAAKVGTVGGHEFDFRIVKPGDTDVPAVLADPNTRGYAEITRNPPRSTVYVKSVEMGPESGANYHVVAHEMLHAVTMQAIEYAQTTDPEGKTKLGAAVRDLNELGGQIVDHINERLDTVPFDQLTPFEQQLSDGRAGNMLEDVHELVAWGLTDNQFQRYLQSIEIKPKQSVWSRFAALLRGIIGLDGRYDTALAELLRASEQVLGADPRELRSAFARNRPEGLDRVTLGQSMRTGGMGAANRTAAASNDAAEQVAAMATRVAENIDLAGLSVKARRFALGWLSHNQLDRAYGSIAPWLLEHSEAHRLRGAVRGRFEQMGDAAYQNYEKLEPKIARQVAQLMRTATEFQLDPDKTWEQHTHLVGDKNAAALRRLYDDVVKMRNDLSRNGGAGIKVFNEFRQLNEAQNYARMSAGLYGLVANDPELTMGVANAVANPVDEFMTQPGLAEPAAIRDWWRAALQRQLLAAEAFVRGKKGEAAAGTDGEQRAMAQHLSPIELQVRAIHEAIAGMAKAPYFHLGRFGDNFGSATIRTNSDGTVDADAQMRVAEALEKAGFDFVQISTDNTRPRISMRFETKTQTDQFKVLMAQLEKSGDIQADSVKAGPRNRDNNWGAVDGLPDYVQRYIQSIEASPLYVPAENATAEEKAALKEQQDNAIRLAVDTWLEMQPDTSISKVLTKRYTIPGYNPDMVRNFAHRWHIGSINIANVATQPKFNNAYVNARAQLNEALDANNPQDPDVLADLLSEIKQRDARNPINDIADNFDRLRAFAHSYFLGFSPAYGMINMTQLGVTALPELAKQHGYAKSFHAMRRASTKAFAVLKAATAEARRLGPRHWADVAITENVLKNAGLSSTDADFARHMLATGAIDIGSSARALGQVAEGQGDSKLNTYLKYASAVGLYTETFSRLVTALAAHDLHGGTDVAKSAAYATNVVSNSMFDYQNWNTARQLGKQGFVGPVTPLLTQFMSYSVQVTEKLYAEAMDAFTKARPGESAAAAAERRTAARRFLLGHATAVTALAGTLGMPFATVFSTVVERLVDAFDDDDEPFDATAAWRGFLSDTLGSDIGEVVARGLPRAVGFDISQRAGEQNLLPFSDFLADRRGWKEALGSVTERSIGAGPSMLLNVATAGEKFASGDVLGGLKDFLPVAFKGPTEAFRMTTDGYIDTKGNRLPLSPGAASIMWQLLGFAPAEKAEYSEARQDQASRRGEINRQATQLRQRIVRAIISGDAEAAREQIERAQQFDEDNPAFAVIPSLQGSLQRQLQARARATALQAPLGVAMDDIAGRQLTRYANVDYAQ